MVNPLSAAKNHVKLLYDSGALYGQIGQASGKPTDIKISFSKISEAMFNNDKRL